jgi:phosphoglycerate dehydrogenase-like enzyme
VSRKIVVQIPKDKLDEFLEPDTFEQLKRLGDVDVNPTDRAYTPDELKHRLADASVCISTWGSTPVTEEMLRTAPKLELHAHMAGSVKPFIAPEAFDRGITVLSGAHAIAEAVAENVLALILAIGHRIVPVNEAMRGGVLWKSPSMETDELRGKTVGLVSLGMVPREVIKLLRPFQVKFLAYDPYVDASKADALGVELAPLHEVIGRSQILSLHAPQIPETYRMIGREELRLVQDGCIMINTSRGNVIDEQALISELKTNRFYAALDVFEQEPLPLESELRKLSNVFVRPHIAGVNPSSRRRIGRALVEDIGRHFNGERVLHAVSKAQLALMT